MNASYRDSQRLDTGSAVRRSSRPATAGTGNEAWQQHRHGGRLVGHQREELPDFQVHALRESDAAAVPTTSSSAVINTGVGHAARHREPRQARPVHGAQAGHQRRRQRLHPAGHRIRYGYVAERRARLAAALVGFGIHVRRGQLLPRRRADRLQHHAVGLGMRHNIHAGYQQYDRLGGSDPQLERLGLDHRSRRRRSASAARRSSIRRRSRRRASALVPKIHSEFRSKSIEVNDAINWKNWTFNLGLLASNDTLYGQGLQNDASHAVGIREGDGNDVGVAQVQDVQRPVQQDAAAAPQHDLGLQRKDTVFASYARYNPAASSLPRAASWDRNLAGHAERRLRRQRQALRRRDRRVVVRQAVRPGPDAARASTSGWSGRRSSSRQASPGAPTSGIARARTTGRTRTTTRASRSAAAAAGIPQALLHRQSERSARADRQRHRQLRDRGARRRVHGLSRADGGRRIPQGPSVGQGSYTRSRYYGNFDQDGSTTARLERRQHLHRLVEHRRRRRPPAVGQQARHCCAAIGRTRSRSTVRIS